MLLIVVIVVNPTIHLFVIVCCAVTCDRAYCDRFWEHISRNAYLTTAFVAYSEAQLLYMIVCLYFNKFVHSALQLYQVFLVSVQLFVYLVMGILLVYFLQLVSF